MLWLVLVAALSSYINSDNGKLNLVLHTTAGPQAVLGSRSVPFGSSTALAAVSRCAPTRICPYCLSYSPLLTRFSTVKPAFFASETESVLGELKVDHTRRTGFLHAGHFVNGAAERGRRNVNLPPHTLQSPSHSSYSYKGITVSLWFTFQIGRLKVKRMRRVNLPGRASVLASPNICICGRCSAPGRSPCRFPPSNSNERSK